MQRCLAKAIALHGLGLYIYAGEDIPTEEFKQEAPKPVDKSVDKPVDKPVAPIAGKITVPAGKGEAEVVDFVVGMCDEFIPTFRTEDGLREFWKSNKSVLARVEAFSKPRYEALIVSFKESVAKLNKE
jgi:hypothetical protein